MGQKAPKPCCEHDGSGDAIQETKTDVRVEPIGINDEIERQKKAARALQEEKDKDEARKRAEEARRAKEKEELERKRAEEKAAKEAAEQKKAKEQAERDAALYSEAAKKQKEQEEAKKKENGASVCFDTPGGEKTVIFTRKPLGFDFEKSAPIKVDQVQAGGHAAELGVDKGWTVKRINGEDMSGRDFETKFDHFVAALRVLPGAVQLGFTDRNGQRELASFSRRPVGFEFDAASPIIVANVEPGSEAAAQGVQVGWMLQTINGEKVNEMDFNTQHTLLAEALKVIS